MLVRLKYCALILCFGGISISWGFSQEIQQDSIPVVQDSLALATNDSLSLPNGQKNQKIDRLISYAKEFLGTPYRYAGTSPSGFDCSGFIYYIMGHIGIPVTRTSYGLAELGQNILLKDIQPGDLMFFKGRNLKSSRVGHVALVVDVSETQIMFIHASSSRGVVIDNFKTSKYYIPRYIKTKRLNY
ncbi:MAG: NlpC/P60 family protein [Bacteroidetes bacterium]|nr:MAG: NlpC/P60 family protein [Bacteroidota bacterium]